MAKIAVVGSNMTDFITYMDHMPLRGETFEARGFEMGHGVICGLLKSRLRTQKKTLAQAFR